MIVIDVFYLREGCLRYVVELQGQFGAKGLARLN